MQLFILILFYTKISLASPQCSSLLNNGFDSFQALERIENEIIEVSTLASNEFGKSQELDVKINVILSELQIVNQSLAELQDIVLADNVIRPSEVHSLTSKLEDLRGEIYKLEKDSATVSEAISVFRDIAESPELVRPEFVYEIETNSSPFKVLFSEKLVSELFLSNDISLLQSLKKSLRTFNKGVHGHNFDGTGIKALVDRKGLFEVRTRGLNSNLRLYGYMHSGVIHFVYWSISSDHSARYIARFANSILAARASRGH